MARLLRIRCLASGHAPDAWPTTRRSRQPRDRVVAVHRLPVGAAGQLDPDQLQVVRWDPFPFILLNLMLSFQAAYTGPVLLMAANRQSEIDRRRAIRNLELEEDDHARLLALVTHLDRQFDALHKRLDG